MLTRNSGLLLDYVGFDSIDLMDQFRGKVRSGCVTNGGIWSFDHVVHVSLEELSHMRLRSIAASRGLEDETKALQKGQSFSVMAEHGGVYCTGGDGLGDVR